MTDLVKRLRDTAFGLYDEGEHDCLYGEAADRIEQPTSRIDDLERDLAEQVNKKVSYYNDWIAEKALAYRLYEVMYSSDWDKVEAAEAAYHKAREKGL